MPSKTKGKATTPEPDYRQPEKGYRFSQDSVLLARYAPQRARGRVADLGAGCGVVGLEALAQGRLRGLDELILIEAGESFRSSLEDNAQRFRKPQGPTITVLMADWRDLDPDDLGGPLDYALANPPYFPTGSSGTPRTERHRARHETLGDLGEFLDAAKRLLKPSGRLAVCWPRARLDCLIAGADDNALIPIKFWLPPRVGCDLVLAEFLA
jgi:tRNA1Val (adenine37-N6)-methyltransferase